jgi:hypothetical protein
MMNASGVQERHCELREGCFGMGLVLSVLWSSQEGGYVADTI